MPSPMNAKPPNCRDGARALSQCTVRRGGLLHIKINLPHGKFLVWSEGHDAPVSGVPVRHARRDRTVSGRCAAKALPLRRKQKLTKPCFLENMCMEPPWPRQMPVFLPNSSAMISRAGTPYAQQRR